MSSPAPFISTQDLVDYLGRGTATDPGMLSATDAACDICRDLAEQSFTQVIGGTAILDGTGTDTLLLPELPVTAAGTVTVNGGTVTDYVLNDNGVLIRKLGIPSSTSLDYYWSRAAPYSNFVWPWPSTPAVVWPVGRQNITVTFNHGYPDADIPRSVRMVALSIATRLVVQGPALQETLGRETSVQYAVASTDLTKGEMAILRKHRPTR